MAVVRTAQAHWEGSLMEGQGEVELVSSQVGSFEVNWPSRADKPNGKTSPEELIAAAHSSCFSMALSNELAKNDTPATALAPASRLLPFVRTVPLTARRAAPLHPPAGRT